MAYAGIIRDCDNGQPIPSVTVALVSEGQLIARVLGGPDGTFNMNTDEVPGAELVFSSAGYKTTKFPATIYQRTFELEKSYIVLDPVELPSHPKTTNILLWALVALAIYKLAGSGRK